jgi:hypothetical protein
MMYYIYPEVRRGGEMERDRHRRPHYNAHRSAAMYAKIESVMIESVCQNTALEWKIDLTVHLCFRNIPGDSLPHTYEVVHISRKLAVLVQLLALCFQLHTRSLLLAALLVHLHPQSYYLSSPSPLCPSFSF